MHPIPFTPLIFAMLFVDASHDAIAEKLENTLMRNVFEKCESDYLGDVIGFRSPDWHPCRVPNRIICSNAKVSLIRIGNAVTGQVQYQYAPTAVQFLGIKSCEQRYALDTRLLP